MRDDSVFGTAVPVAFGEGLRERARGHLAGFVRRRHPPLQRRPAAVALVLLPDEEGRACFLLTRRADRLRAHARQWALPGGRMEPGESAEAAALRELQEEVGLTLPADAVLGVLDDYPTRSGFVITPVVVWCAGTAELMPNPDEVARVYHVPLQDLERPEVPILISIPESERPVIQLPILSTLIHAPTAAVIYQLREVVVHGRDTRVDHFEQPVWAWR
jgi:8-oxo-dGTP pyrophosphatase MutT (NUDIX family)